jgi:hypothetical protein
MPIRCQSQANSEMRQEPCKSPRKHEIPNRYSAVLCDLKRGEPDVRGWGVDRIIISPLCWPEHPTSDAYLAHIFASSVAPCPWGMGCVAHPFVVLRGFSPPPLLRGAAITFVLASVGSPPSDRTKPLKRASSDWSCAWATLGVSLPGGDVGEGERERERERESKRELGGVEGPTPPWGKLQ